MDNNELLELDHQSRETELMIMEQVRKDFINGRKVSMKEYYPEFNLKGTWTNNLPDDVLTQLPFFDTIIFNIEPMPEDKFNETYNISIDQALKLFQKDKLLFVRSTSLSRYAGYDYLDPILDLNPPNLIRRGEFLNIARLGNEILKNNKIISDRIDLWLKDLDDPPISELSFITKNSIKQDATSLYCSGFNELTDIILNHPRIEDSALLLFSLKDMLIDVPKCSIGGFDSIHSEKAKVLKLLGIPLPASSVFPIDLSQIIIKDLKLLELRNCLFDEVFDICSETAEARKILFELNEYVSHLEIENALNRKDAIEECFKETNEIIHDMASRRNSVEKWIGFNIGMTGAMSGAVLGGLAGPPGMLVGGLLGGLTGMNIFESIADRYLKLGIPPHVTAIYDYKKK